MRPDPQLGVATIMHQAQPAAAARLRALLEPALPTGLPVEIESIGARSTATATRDGYVVLLDVSVDDHTRESWLARGHLVIDATSTRPFEAVTRLKGESMAATPHVVYRDGRPSESLTRRELRLVAQHCLEQADIDAFLFDAGLPRGRLRAEPHLLRVLDLLYLITTEALEASFAEWMAYERQRCFTRRIDDLRASDPWKTRDP